MQQTYDLFRNGPLKDRFLGNIEGRDVHSGVADVIVTDGFVGNVVLKHAEGLFDFIMQLVGQDVVGALSAERELADPGAQDAGRQAALQRLRRASLLGVDGVCVICHGSSDERAIANALGVAAQDVRVRLNDRIVEELAALPVLGDGEE